MKKIALPTLHGKGAQIIPVFRELHPFEIIELPIDTDSFGTFSGEKERTTSPLETAIAKASMAIDLTGWDGAIASEGSIGMDPAIPFINSDREVVVFVDATKALVVHESYRSFEIVAAQIEYRSGDDLEPFLLKADFPRHRLIVKTKKDGSLFVIKGIEDRDQLNDAIRQALDGSDLGSVIIENDLRAHCSPSRQLNIERAAKLLAERLARHCPQCETFGWGRVDHLFGVECRECGHLDLRVAHREINGCIKCEYREEGKILREMIDAGECERCNP